MRPANRCCGMIILVKGDLTVNGTISADKCCPLQSPNEELLAQERHIAACGALTGGRGGNGSRGESSSNSGGQGGDPCAFGGGYGGGGAGTRGGGGIVAIVHTGDYINSGSIVVSGGNGGAAGSDYDDESLPGNSGSVGTTFVSTLDELLS